MVNKTENVNVRLDPKLRYGLELLTRKQRRNASQVITWAITKELCNELFTLEVLNQLWHTDKIERINKLKKFDKSLLTIEEELVLKREETP